MSSAEALQAPQSTRHAVEDAITQVAFEQGRSLPALSDSLKLVDSGLDSLCLAVIVARLEDELGVDPFSDATNFTFPHTIGDLIALYESALA